MVATVSIVAVAVIFGCLAWGWSRRFLAAGALAVANIIVFGLTALGPGRFDRCGPSVGLAPDIHWDLALCAQNLYDGKPLGALQLITSMFVHADLMHLIGNLFILLVFAITFEELIGPRRLIIVYLSTGLIAAGSQLGVSWGQPLLLMGASGAAAGIAGAFAGAFPHMVMRLPIPGPIIFFARMRVITWAVMFALMQIVLQTTSRYVRSLGGVAYAAHLGGLAAGLALGYWWLKRASASKQGEAPKYPLDGLDAYAGDAATRRALDEMRSNVDEPEVFQIWADRFWAAARDPVSGKPVRMNRRGEVVERD